MKLAALCVESVLFGVFLTLVIAIFYVLSRRSTAAFKTSSSSRHHHLLIALILLLAMLTGHWISTVIRAFDAFVSWRHGKHASEYYAEITGPACIAQSVFHSATVIVADAIVIARLYIICDYHRTAIILPALLTTGLLVSAVGIAYAYGAYRATVPATLTSLHDWKMAHSVFTICTNIFCTVVIVWRVERVKRQAPNISGGTSLTSVILLMAESAACYTSIVLVTQITYGLGHVSNYFFMDCIPPVAALAAVLAHARAVLAKERNNGRARGFGEHALGFRGQPGAFAAQRGINWGGGRASETVWPVPGRDGRRRMASADDFGSDGSQIRLPIHIMRSVTVESCTDGVGKYVTDGVGKDVTDGVGKDVTDGVGHYVTDGGGKDVTDGVGKGSTDGTRKDESCSFKATTR
ncbi:hypothetical protein BD626DRAFT_408885 [Schizophyllum amplum]|uniref:Uncharacterized protein n=1 Tax=Schizophyllum amplum TaxID=97359 RepID=A0A550C4D2_9AGAR|nr:hypothetical protein BD626DRAFT_408885 [Auriculariopsis ampla]